MSRERTAQGWNRRGIQIPDPIDKAFASFTKSWGTDSIKNTSTISFGLFLGLRFEVKQRLYVRLIPVLVTGHRTLTPDRIWQETIASINEAAAEAGIDSSAALGWATQTGTTLSSAPPDSPTRRELDEVNAKLDRLLAQNGGAA